MSQSITQNTATSADLIRTARSMIQPTAHSIQTNTMLSEKISTSKKNIVTSTVTSKKSFDVERTTPMALQSKFLDQDDKKIMQTQLQSEEIEDLTQADQSLNQKKQTPAKSGEKTFSSDLEKLLSARPPVVSYKTDVGEQQQDIIHKWYDLHWPTIGLGACLCVSTLDPSQSQLLAEYSRAYGGLYFLLVYFLLVWTVQMPLSFLLIHWGQYAQAGLTKTTHLFGHVHRSIGYAMIVWLIISSAVQLNNAAEQVDHTIHLSPHLTEFVQCKMKDLDCYMNLQMSYCCDSLKESMACSKDLTNAMCPITVPTDLLKKFYTESDDDEHCKANINQQEDRILKPSPVFFWRSKTLAGDYEFGTLRSFIMTLTILGCGLVAIAGKTVFSVIFTILGIVTVIIIMVNCGYLIGTGFIGVGVQRLVRLSQPERIFSLDVLFALFTVTIAPVNLKFFTISISSLRRKRAEAFSTAMILTMLHVFVSLLFLCSNLSMTGRMEYDGKEHKATTSITSITNQGLKKRKEYWQNFLPEYFSVYEMETFYAWHSLSHFFLHLFPILGTFFTVFEVNRYYANRNFSYPMTNIISSCVLVGTILFIATIMQVLNHFLIKTRELWMYPNVSGRFHGLDACMGCVLLLMFNMVTVLFYGSNEFYIDLCFLYPITKTFHDKYGPISELFRSALHFFCPLVLHIIAVMLYFQYRYTFDYEKSGLMSKILELLVPAAPSYVLAAFIGIDVGKILYLLTKRRHWSTIWNLFYLTEEHPSYRRTMLTYHMEKIDRQEESTKQTR